MTIPAFWHASWTAGLVNHLWQSTVIAALAWLLASALRKNHAGARYWVWMAASLKFLVPFSLLIGAGRRLASLMAAPAAIHPAIVNFARQVEQPFPQAEYFGIGSAAAADVHHAEWIPLLLAAVWFCGVLLVAARWLHGWMRIRAMLRGASPVEIGAQVPSFSTNAATEPGIFGVFRPVLLLPQQVLIRLSRAQLDAIVVHEMAHVRRRDNLTYAVHMAVEALFWFYPPVWWIGARLIEERERACDEAVVRAGGNAETYAEGILNVCKICIESPLACAAGVTGAELKERIARIMAGKRTQRLNLSSRLLIGAAGAMAVAVPLILGISNAPEILADTAQNIETVDLPRFDVVSFKPYKAGAMMVGIRLMPDGLTITGMPLFMMVREAFGLSDDRILNEPGWVRTERYDVAAKVDPADASKLEKLDQEQRWAMMLPVLEDRCGLKFHHETRTLEVYTLVEAKGGLKLKPADPAKNGDAMGAAGQPGATSAASSSGGVKAMGQFFMRMSAQGMSLNAHGVPMPALARMLSLQLGSTVLDKTGLTGKYDYKLNWAPDRAPGGMQPGPEGGPSPASSAPPEAAGPSLVTALQEQLGLKLEARKEAVDVVVIDHIEKPSPN